MTNSHVAVMKAVQSYIDGVRLGDSNVMRSRFHENATIFGHYPGGVMANPIKALFDWIDQSGRSSRSSRCLRTTCGKKRSYVRHFHIAANR